MAFSGWALKTLEYGDFVVSLGEQQYEPTLMLWYLPLKVVFHGSSPNPSKQNLCPLPPLLYILSLLRKDWVCHLCGMAPIQERQAANRLLLSSSLLNWTSSARSASSHCSLMAPMWCPCLWRTISSLWTFPSNCRLWTWIQICPGICPGHYSLHSWLKKRFYLISSATEFLM